MNDIKIKFDKTILSSIYKFLGTRLGFILVVASLIIFINIIIGKLVIEPKKESVQTINVTENKEIPKPIRADTKNIKRNIIPDSVKKTAKYDIEFYTRELYLHKKGCTRDCTRLGDAHFALLEIETALKYYEQALEWDPENDEIKNNIELCKTSLLEMQNN